MESTSQTTKQVLDELFTLLEAMETQSIAIVQFLKDQKMSTDAQMAPYMDQASNAASVKWRAARVRMEYLFSSTENQPAVSDESKEKAETKKAEENSEKEANAETTDEKQETETKAIEEKTGAKNLQSGDSAAKETAKSENKPASRNDAGPEQAEVRKAEGQTKNGEEKKEMTAAAANAGAGVEIKKAGKENSAAQKLAAKRT